jgi:NAD(P)-dependent dehydrogenase (short-subunit alcohol dehydrogenase family)
VITGASTGIGEACALYLDRLGFQIFVGVRKTADGEVLKRKGSDRLTPVLIDVTDTASIQSAAENVTKAVGERGLVGLVNNAGIAVVGPLEFLPIDDLRQQLEVNVVGQIAVTQAFLPLLRKGFGRIVNVGSMSGKIATPFIGAYAASKFALEALTDSLRMELQPWGISVSIIEPGKVATPIWKKTKVTTEERMKRLPQEGYDFYGPVMVSIIKNTDKMGKAGIPADTVAEVITRALTARRPKTRYLVGRDAKLATLIFRRLPDRMRDWLIAQGLKRREEVS